MRLNATQRSLNAIEHNRPCTRCGYNLKGLAPGGQCPECGAPIRARISSSEIAPAVLESPVSQLLTLSAGCYGIAGSIGLLLIVRFTLAIGRASELWLSSLTACVELVFVSAVVLATFPRPGGVQGRVLPTVDLVARWMARGLAACGLLGTLAKIAAELSAGGTTNWQDISMGLSWGGRLAVIPLAIALSGLATSAVLESLAWRLRSIVGLLLVSILLSVLADWMGGVGAVGVGAWIFSAIGLIAWMFGWGVLLLGAFEIGSTMHWAVRYTDEAAAREMRRSERERREYERAPLPVSSPIGSARGRPDPSQDDLPIPLAGDESDERG